MEKDVEVMVMKGSGKIPKVKQGRKPDPLRSAGAQKLLEDDAYRTPDVVKSSTTALIEEGFLPSQQHLDEGFLSTEVYECLARLDKKDSATKLKALSDFLQIISTKDVADVINSRTFWARLFVSFLEDEDPRVRELASRCQQQYVNLLKKDILPVLSRIIGPWWLSQFQMHSAAATASRSAFQSAFTQQKRPEVLRRYGKDILTLLRNRILPKSSLVDKAKSKGQDVSSLNDDQQSRMAEGLDALSGLVQELSAEGLDEMYPLMKDMLDKPDWWKLVRLQNPKVRQSFYRLLSALWNRCEEAMKAYTLQTLTAAIGSLHDKDLRTASEVWELLLLVISKDDQWSTIINTEKILQPKLISLLKNGGFGCAKVVFPSLIVLIDKLPNKKLETYESLINALVHGLASEEVRSTDIAAICQALSDAFRYIVKKEEKEVAMKLVENQLVPLYLDAFFGNGSMLKGWEVVQAMVLSWIGKGGSEREYASLTLSRLAEKLVSVDAQELNVERTRLWWQKLMDGAVRASVSSSGKNREVLERYILADTTFQDVVVQLFRLALRLVQTTADEPNVQFFNTLLTDVHSTIVYSRLKAHLEDTPTDLSPQRLIIQSLPSLLDGSPAKLPLFTRLLSDCQSSTDVQDLFNLAWTTFPDRLRLLKQLDVALVKRLARPEHMADLISLAESLLNSQGRQAMEDAQNLMVLLAELQRGTSGDLIGQFLAKAQGLDLKQRLRLYGSVMKAGIEASNVASLTVLALVDLAAEEREREVTEISEVFASMADRLANEWNNNPQVIQKLQHNINEENFTNSFVKIAKCVSGKNGKMREEFVQLALNTADFDAVAESVLKRRDVFVGRLTLLEMNEEVKLEHVFWDEEMKQAAASCLFVVALVDVEEVTGENVEKLAAFLRCLLVVAAYNQLALLSPPMVFDEGLRCQAEGYRQLFQKGLTEKTYSFLSQKYPDENLLPSFWNMGDDGDLPSKTSAFNLASVEQLSALNLAVQYSDMLDDEKLGGYGRSLRDRLEQMLTSVEVPTTVVNIQQTSWSQVQLLRLLPSLLHERCLDLSYSGSVLDKFGSVVIDWIACLQSPDFTLDSVKVLVLLQEALNGVAGILKGAESLKDSGMLWLELTEFSFPRILASLLDALLRFAEEGDQYLTQRHPLVARLMASVCGVIQLFAAEAQGLLRPVWETMFKLEIGLPDGLSPLQSRPVDMVLAFIRLFAPLLLHKVAHFQLVSTHVLTNLIPFFPPTYRTENIMAVMEIGQVSQAKNKESTKDLEAKTEPLPPPIELLSLLEESGDIVETILDDVALGEAFGDIVPQTDSYTYMLGYLMTWKVVLAWISNESNEAKQAFAKYLESTGKYSDLLDHLTRLLPLHSDDESEGRTKELARFVPGVMDMHVFSPDVYASALQQMPMLARAWFSRKQGTVARDVDKYTVRHVTGQLVKTELMAADIQARHVMFDNFKISVRPTVAEITAEYRVEVWIAEIVIRIPKDYPLSSATVSWGRTKGSASDAWDQWVIRLRGFLQRQNGSIMDGLLAWKSSVDKKFKDIQACAICLAIVEVKSAALPQMQCKTCKNKFHNACLYRWFEQQVDPTCPLCREKFF